jgi:hypothetical protein
VLSLILGIFGALAGSGIALFALGGLVNSTRQAATSAPLVKPKKKAGRFKAPKQAGSAPEKKKHVFKAPEYATAAERDNAELMRDPGAMGARDREIADLLKVSRAAEMAYDELKDQEGIGAITSMMRKTLDGLLGGGWVGMLTATAQASWDGFIRSVEGNEGNKRKAAWRLHESALAQALALVAPYHLVTKTTHAGEEYDWHHAIIISPSIGIMSA